MVIFPSPHVFPIVTRTYWIPHVPQTIRTHTPPLPIETRWTLPLPRPLPHLLLLFLLYRPLM
jgi:hypothetical protein